jgi:tetratricopeptide (TPR) repeat protein
MPVLSRAKLSAECGGLMKQALCSDVTHCSDVTVCSNVIHQVMPNGRAAMSWDGRKMSQRIPSSSGSHKQDKLLWFRLGHALVAIFTCFAMMIGCQRQESSLQPASSSEQTMAGPGERQQLQSTASDFSGGNNGEAGEPSRSSKDDQQVTASVKSKPSVDQLREAALQALGAGQDDLAFDYARQAMRIAPENPQVVFLLAMVLGDRHRYAEAIQLLQELAAREPTTRLPALGQTAEWMVESGRYDEAELQFRNVLQEVPDALMVHHRLGQLLLQTGRRTEAALHFDILSQFGELDHEELRALLIRAQAFPGDDGVSRFDPLNNLAMCRQELADGKSEQVMEVIVAAGDSNSAAEKALLARLLAEQEKFDDVRKWLDPLEMKTAGADGWYAKGCLALNDAELKLAVACFCQTLLLDQTDVAAYRMLSRALELAGQPEIANAVAQRAVLVDETRKLGAKLVGDEARNLDLILQLAQSLMKLNRPMEAFGWQTIRLVHAVEAAAITEAQAQTTFEAIGRQREQLVKSGMHRINPEFVLCGLGAEVLDPIASKSAD